MVALLRSSSVNTDITTFSSEMSVINTNYITKFSVISGDITKFTVFSENKDHVFLKIMEILLKSWKFLKIMEICAK